MTSKKAQMDSLMDSFPQVQEILDPDRIGFVLRSMFYAFIERTIPNEEYTITHLTGFVRSLVKNQRGVGKFIVEPGSWSLISLDETAPSDVRVDYIFFPTYYVVSLLTLFLLRYPEEASRINGYQDALHRGFRFAGMRGLWGHGIEGGEQREQAIEIMMDGEVPEYLDENADKYPQLQPLIDAILDYTDELEKRFPPKLVRMYIRLSDFKEGIAANRARI